MPPLQSTLLGGDPKTYKHCSTIGKKKVICQKLLEKGKLIYIQPTMAR